MLDKFVETKLWQYLQDILDALGGGSGGGTASAANQTAVQANAGSDATKAIS